MFTLVGFLRSSGAIRPAAGLLRSEPAPRPVAELFTGAKVALDRPAAADPLINPARAFKDEPDLPAPIGRLLATSWEDARSQLDVRQPRRMAASVLRGMDSKRFVDEVLVPHVPVVFSGAVHKPAAYLDELRKKYNPKQAHFQIDMTQAWRDEFAEQTFPPPLSDGETRVIFDPTWVFCGGQFGKDAWNAKHRDEYCFGHFALQLAGRKLWVLESRNDTAAIELRLSADGGLSYDDDGPFVRADTGVVIDESRAFYETELVAGELLLFFPYLLHGTSNLDHESFSINGYIRLEKGTATKDHLRLPRFCSTSQADNTNGD